MRAQPASGESAHGSTQKVCRRSVRLEPQRVHGPAGQKGRGLAMDPGLVADAVERGERMAALPAGHLENSLVLDPGGDDEALARAVDMSLDPRHVRVPRQRIGGQVEITAEEPGQETAEGMLDAGRIVAAPSGTVERYAFTIHFLDDAVGGGEQQVVPAGEAGIEQVRRLPRQHRPEGGLIVETSVVKFWIRFDARGENRGEDEADDLGAE